MAGCASPTAPCSSTSRATAPAPNSGAPRCASSTRAVERAYGGRRRIEWFEVYAGEKSNQVYGPGTWLPEETLAAFREYLVGIKGPLTTPVGGGIRSINVALRQLLDLYVCLRPVRWYRGVPSPVRKPQNVDMVIFRENTEDIYAGIEWEAGTPEAAKVIEFLTQQMGVKQIRFPGSSSIGIKPVSEEGTKRLVRAALRFALAHGRRNLTLVHKGNIMKFTEGGFRKWGYEVAKDEFGAQTVSWEECGGDSAGRQAPGQGRHRRQLPPADPDAPGRVRRGRHHEPERRLHLGRARGPGRRARASRRGRTSTTTPATPSSRRPTARPPSTRGRTRSTPARSSSPA